ncbi:ABC transporter permease [Paenibacillus sp. FSL H3-0333]|uniref:ABC transporter permease n=1 Tax=Paenibacillus sp. FSL H3-0333 TaxID=2921373 RepID=UPI0030F512D7
MEKYRLCNVNNLLIAALFILLSLIVVVFNYYQVQHNELNQLSRGLYTKNSIFFTIKEKAIEINWSEIETSDDYTIFSELGSVEKNGSWQELRAIYFNKSTYDPPLAEGRFFNNADFYNNDNLAVIGKNIDGTDLLEKAGELYYTFAGRNYKVIGIMGAPYSSKLDDTVFVNLDSLQSDSFMDSTVYVMNIAHNPITSNLKLPFLQNDLPIHVFDRGDSGTVRAMNIGTQQLMVTFIFIILLFSTSVISALFWMNRKKSEILVLWQCGISLKTIGRRILSTYMAIALACYIFVATGSMLFFKLSLTFNRNSLFIFIQGLEIGLLAVLITSALVVWIFYVQVAKRITLKGKTYR